MLRQFITVLGGFTTIIAGFATVGINSVQAAPVKFECREYDGLPTTVAYNNGKETQIIRWYSEYFGDSGYDSLTRCRAVTKRFQSAYNKGTLDYITAGIVNGYPVVCTTTAGGSCDYNNVLFTLKKGTNAAKTLQRLFNVRDLGAAPLYESSGKQYISIK
ncbi:MAG: hypothetical protein D6756_00850, partial [Cyanobacteria bacterium J083]